MSIFIENQNENPTPVQNTANEIRKLNTEVRDSINKIHQKIFNELWFGIQPIQDVLNEFGNDAYLLFIFSQQIQKILTDADPNYQYLVPPLPYTINQDGTVTINT